jgi:hypothetical protein
LQKDSRTSSWQHIGRRREGQGRYIHHPASSQTGPKKYLITKADYGEAFFIDR